VIGSNKSIAQQALRSALESDAAARLRNEPVVRPSTNALRWGAATFDIGLSYSLEATDNSTFEERDRQKDLIQRPLLTLGVQFPLSPRARLDFRTGVGYQDYVDNTVEDTFFIPSSELALDVRAGNGLVTFFDRFEYSQEIAEQGALTGVGRFPELENEVGLRSVWNFDKWVYYAGYSHLNVFIIEDSGAGTADFSYLERAEELFFGRAGYKFDHPVELGVEATGTLADYEAEVQRDYYTVSAGPYVTWTAADALEIRLRGGVAYTVFSGTNGFAEEEDLTSYYAGVEIDHRLTDHITYGFSATHDIEPGISVGSDYVETTRLELDIAWRMTRYLTLTSLIFAEAAQEVGVAETEDYRRFGISIGPIYQVSSRLSCFARYAFNLRDSDIESRSYRENRVSIGGTYRF
jgi:predicted porin